MCNVLYMAMIKIPVTKPPVSNVVMIADPGLSGVVKTKGFVWNGVCL